MSDAELHKHKCAVRHFCALREQMGLQQFRFYVKTVKPFTWEKFFSDFSNQWKKGNRGIYGDWR
jgi:hypothetical protein